jgi:hypothetical protein
MVYKNKELKDIFSYFNINNYFFLFIIKMESFNKIIPANDGIHKYKISWHRILPF